MLARLDIGATSILATASVRVALIESRSPAFVVAEAQNSPRLVALVRVA
jgi:hypothetical protein